MNDLELGWIIGILEGEGQFASYEGQRYVAVQTTDEWVVDHLQELIGGRKYGPRFSGGPNRKPHWKASYMWKLLRWREVELLTMCIIDHLSPRRREQAQCLLDNPPRSFLDAKLEVEA